MRRPTTSATAGVILRHGSAEELAFNIGGRATGQRLGVALRQFRFEQIVGLAAQLAFRLGDQIRNVHLLRQYSRYP